MKTALDKLDGTELKGRRIKLTEESKLRGRRSQSEIVRFFSPKKIIIIFFYKLSYNVLFTRNLKKLNHQSTPVLVQEFPKAMKTQKKPDN